MEVIVPVHTDESLDQFTSFAGYVSYSPEHLEKANCFKLTFNNQGYERTDLIWLATKVWPRASTTNPSIPEGSYLYFPVLTNSANMTYGKDGLFKAKSVPSLHHLLMNGPLNVADENGPEMESHSKGFVTSKDKSGGWSFVFREPVIVGGLPPALVSTTMYGSSCPTSQDMHYRNCGVGRTPGVEASSEGDKRHVGQ